MPEQFLHGVEVVEIDDGIRAIRTVRSSIIGLVGTAPDADDAEWPLDQPVLVAGPRQAASLGAAGTLRDAYEAVYAQGAAVAIVVRAAEGADAAETQANVVGAIAAQTGAYALLTAEASVKQTPRILAAPGFTGARDGAANPVAAALVAVAERLRAVVIADGPSTSEADAIAWAGDFGSDRLYVVDPAVIVYDAATAANVVRPASPYVAGALAASDIERGFWWSPSNTVLNNVLGTARPIAFGLGDPETEANRLNEANVATIVHQNGFRLWGNRSLSDDPLWAFLSVRRTADLIYDSLEAAHLWAMDRPFSAQLILDIEGTVRAYLRRLEALGAVLGGEVWLDPELNTQGALQDGKLFVNFDIEPPAPLEHLTFRAYRNGAYYEELAAEIAAA